MIDMESKCEKCNSTKNIHSCGECAKLFCEEHIEYAPDPYQEEFYNDTTKVWQCEDCRHEGKRDI